MDDSWRAYSAFTSIQLRQAPASIVREIAVEKKNSMKKSQPWNIMRWWSLLFIQYFLIFREGDLGARVKATLPLSGLLLNVTLCSCHRTGAGMPHRPHSASLWAQPGTVTACKCCFCDFLKCWEACYTPWQLMDHCAEWWHTMPWQISLNATECCNIPTHLGLLCMHF